MGAICSKPGTLEGGHKVVGATRALGGTGAGVEGSVAVNPRQAALEAAEKRRQAVSFLVVMGRRRSLTHPNLCFYCTGTTEGDEPGQSESG